MRLVASDSPGGILARRLLPAAVLVPAVLALVCQWGEQAGLYGTGFGRGLLVASNSVILVGLIWWTAAAVVRSDELHRAAENAVRESEAYLSVTLDSIGDAVIATDELGRIVRLNPVAERLTGWPAADARGRPLPEVFRIVNEETGVAVDNPVDRVLRDGIVVGLANHTALIARDGTTRAIANSAAPIRDAQGTTRGVVLVFQDHSEARAAERRVRDSEARRAAILVRSNDRLRVLAGVSEAFATVATAYQPLLDKIARTIADLVGDGCFVTLISSDGERLVNEANAHRDPALELDYKTSLAGIEVLRRTSSSVYATVIRTEQAVRADVVPSAMVAQTDEALKPIVARLNVHSLVVVPIRVRQTVIGTLSLLRNQPGHSYTDEDVTLLQDLADRAGLAIENARLYDQLEHRVRERTVELELANKELEAFSYSVAHDLRAPMRTVSGFSQALLEDFADRLEPEARRYATRIRDAANHMGQLIEGLLHLSYISRTELHRERVDLSTLARIALARLQIAHPDRNVEIVVESDLVANADPRLLEIALTNLLGNAWKFTGKRAHARIEIAAIPGTRPTTYLVRDNGAGFAPADAEKLFGVFQRLHGAHEFEGTGIGLATVQRIIHNHGGRLWAEGEVDSGATFYFTLEAAD